MTPDDPRHGKNSGYNAGCHDNCCTHAHMVYRKRNRMGQTGAYIESYGTHRRLQALCALGHTLAGLGRESGMSTPWAHSILRSNEVHTNTAAMVATLYERLSMTIPQGWVAERQRGVSRKKGWATPLAWVDIDDPDERPGKGFKARQKSTTDHIRAEHLFLSQLGESDHSIAAKLGLTERSLIAALSKGRSEAA